MKKMLAAVAVAVLAVFAVFFGGCELFVSAGENILDAMGGGNKNEEAVYHRVQYIDGDFEVCDRKVRDGESVEIINIRDEKDREFVGWLCDGEEYDFTRSVTADLILYANWRRVDENKKPTITFVCGDEEKVLEYEAGGRIDEPPVPEREHYAGKWQSYELDGTDIRVEAEYTPIEYTLSFVADGETVDEFTYTIETESIVEPEVPAKRGYTGAWESYELDLTDKTVNAVYTAIEYTITFKADDNKVTDLVYTIETENITEPEVPTKRGYTGVWESYELDLTDKTINAVYTAIEYTITFKADDNEIADLVYTIETESIVEPEVPAKLGYTGAWESYELDLTDKTVNAVYTAVEYTITFKADDNEIADLVYTIETESIVEPEVPTKRGYTGAWESYELDFIDKTVNAVYTAIEYTITFKADDNKVADLVYTIENESIVEPEVPTKLGYTGAWESYELDLTSKTVNAVYSALPGTEGLEYGETGGVLTVTGYSGNETHIEIPIEHDGKTVQNIAVNAFNGQSIEEVVIYANITVIPEQAFINCAKLAQVDLPETLGLIDKKAFSGCTALSYIDVPSGVTKIDESAFYMSGLKSIKLLEGLTEIGRRAFTGCPLTEITLPDSVKTVGMQAFMNCAALEKVRLGAGLERIGANAFTGCNALMEIEFANVENWRTADGEIAAEQLSTPTTAAEFIKNNARSELYREIPVTE